MKTRVTIQTLYRCLLTSSVCVLLLTACVQNPVTGRNDFLLVSEDWELQIGEEHYLPLRQQQGGDYVVDPGVEAYVRKIGQRLADKSDRQLPYEFNVINDSTPNAWALPGGKISINRGLLVQLKNEAELAAVLGHEIVHAAAKHGARGQTRGVGLQLGVMTATILGARNGYGELAQLGSSVGAQLINSQYGQSAELEADRFGMDYMARAGFNPQGAVELQKTFVRLSEGRESNALERLFASHPPSERRVQENIKTARSLGTGGALGEARYRKEMATLFKTLKAYEAFDKAQAALQQGRTQQALALTQEAISIEPREAHFHSLVGDIALMQNNLNAARRGYDRAISLNNEFYYYYLQRGKVHEAQRNIRAAQADYAYSMRLLPSADAQLALGQFAERGGKTEVAKRYYAMASQAEGASGDKARQSLMRLQPTTNPNGRLLVRQGLTPKGTFAIELLNQTSRPVTNIRLGITVAPGVPQRVEDISQSIAAGQRRVIDTGRRLSATRAAQVKVVILQADIAG